MRWRPATGMMSGVRRAGGLALAVAALVASTAASTNPGRASGLVAIESAFRSAATRAGAVTIPGSRCYETTGAGGVVTGGVCGPVAYPGDPIGGWWQQLRVSGTKPLTFALGAHGQALTAG